MHPQDSPPSNCAWAGLFDSFPHLHQLTSNVICLMTWTTMVSLIETLTLNTMQVQDNLLTTKVAQAEFTNHHHSNELVFTLGDHVLLSTKH
jgi:hypothetical protein